MRRVVYDYHQFIHVIDSAAPSATLPHAAVAFDAVGVAKILPFYFQNPAGHLVPSSPLRSPCRSLFQRQNPASSCVPLGSEKKCGRRF